MEVSHLLPILVNLTPAKAPLVMSRQEASPNLDLVANKKIPVFECGAHMIITLLMHSKMQNVFLNVAIVELMNLYQS
jgi:hypothetical protein